MKVKKNIAISESGFVFNPTSGDSFSVNPIGLEIINRLKDGEDTDSIKTALLTKYNVDSGTVDKDLYDFEKMLEKFGLLDNQ